MIKAVLFDLDNTLVDFMKMKHLSCEAAIDAMIGAGLDTGHEHAKKVLFDLYDKFGLEEKTIFQKFLKKVEGKINYKILASGIVAYRKVRSGFLEPYPNVDFVLLKLKAMGLKTGIVTDAPRLKAWIRLASMRLTNYFDVVITFDDTRRHKPSKHPFMAALKKLDLKAEECLMIGDWPERDIKGASKLGMRTVLAKYGQVIPGRGANMEIDSVEELLELEINKAFSEKDE